MARLTLKIAKELTKSMWAHLAATGDTVKTSWPGYAEAEKKYGSFTAQCPLCQYTAGGKWIKCSSCPYFMKFGSCTNSGSPYWEWSWAGTVRLRKIHAKAFLEQLNQL